jgi:hypothetical protein
MSESQFRDFTLDSLQEGRKQFDEIKAQLAAMADHMEKMSAAILENTALTKQTAELAASTAADTAGLVAIERFGRSAADVAAAGARGITWGAKLLISLSITVALVTMILHGKLPTWQEIVSIVK